MLSGRRSCWGSQGSIAAYKAALIVRLLVKQQAEVQVIMTPDARNFITPLTPGCLSGKTSANFFGDHDTRNLEQPRGPWRNGPDALMIAPATANTLAAASHGICDNLPLAAYLSPGSVFFAPAMDLTCSSTPQRGKYQSTAIASAITSLPPALATTASGLTGPGRMAEPEEIIQHLNPILVVRACSKASKRLRGRSRITAPDPVRFIGNHSTGKMGFAIAESL